MKLRGFEAVQPAYLKHENVPTLLPRRADSRSAGYDLPSKETVTIQPGESHLFWSDLKAYMQPSEVLFLHVRSSIGIKKGLRLKNTTGIIDASYYSNPSNDGNIGICLINTSTQPVTVEMGERIAQAIFMPYLIADGDETLHAERAGGFGSSNR